MNTALNLIRIKNFQIFYSKIVILLTAMGIKFKKPSLDTCNTCDTLKMQIEMSNKNHTDRSVTESLEQKLIEHQTKADEAYEAKRIDKSFSISKKSTVQTFTFDLQQCLPTPMLRTSTSFYKRSLWTYNLTVHECSTNEAFCYMWHEAVSKRGANQISSCLLKHLQYLDSFGHIKHVIYYSDSCPGQNRNSILSIMFTTFIQSSSNIEIIDHKFLEPGHTHMESDTDHALIERKKKKTDVKIHHPRDWYNFIPTVGIKNKFHAIEMVVSDFKNFATFVKSKFFWRNRAENSDTFVWKNVRWLRYNKTHYGKIYYKATLSEEEFKILNIQKRGVRSVDINQVPIINDVNKISSKKKKDLEDLLPLIDEEFHNFYKSLLTEDSPDFHPDLFDNESSSEREN